MVPVIKRYLEITALLMMTVSPDQRLPSVPKARQCGFSCHDKSDPSADKA